jgi:hypothetical protein
MKSPEQTSRGARDYDTGGLAEGQRYSGSTMSWSLAIAVTVTVATCTAVSSATAANTWAIESGLLLALIAAAFGAKLVAMHSRHAAAARRAFMLFFASLIFTVIWHAFAYHTHATGSALAVAIGLWLCVVWTAAAFWSVIDVAGVLMVGLWLWATAVIILSGRQFLVA